MMKKLKTTFALLKYGFQIKMNLVLAFVFLLFGFLLFFLGSATDCVMAFFLVHAPTFILQISITFLYVGLVKSSPLAKFLEIDFTDTISSLSSLIGYSLFLLLVGVKSGFSSLGAQSGTIVAGSLLIFMLNVYFCFSYKYFVFSILGVYLSMIVIMPIPLLIDGILEYKELTPSALPACIIGYGIVLAGILLSRFFRRLMYRKPLSKWAAGSELRKCL